MARRTFEQWVDGIFDHPVAESAWYWAASADTCVEDDETNAGYLARLFAESERTLARFDDAQVGQGLNMIAHNACSDHAFAIIHGEAPWPVRARAIRAIYDLYAGCFARRCDPRELGHHGGLRGDPLRYICYMWWEVFPAWADPANADERWEAEACAREADECLAVMDRCLSIEHDACLEGTLHGLGHWQLIYPERVGPIIDRFLSRRPDLRPELAAYAGRAREGAVQ